MSKKENEKVVPLSTMRRAFNLPPLSDRRKRVENKTEIREVTIGADGEPIVSVYYAEDVPNTNPDSYTEASLATLIKNGISPKKLNIQDDCRLGADNAFKACYEYIDKNIELPTNN